MANILLDAANWYDSDYGQPPSYWNGNTYDYIGSVPSGQFYGGATMQYMGTVHAGDIIAFTIKSTSADPTEFGVTVNGSSVYSQTLETNQTYTFSSAALSAGDTVVVTLGVNDYLYSQDAVLMPTPPQPPTYPPTTEVMLSWSDDGGHNFANRQVQDMGEIGQTAQRVIFRRIGSTRRNSGLDRVFELSSEAPVQVCLVGASLNES